MYSQYVKGFRGLSAPHITAILKVLVAL